MKTITSEQFRKLYGLKGSTQFASKNESYMKDAISDVRQIGSEIATSYKDRVRTIDNAKIDQKLGIQTPGETLYQVAGNAAGLVSDVFGSIIKGGTKAVLPQETEDAAKKAIGSVSKPIADNDIVRSILEKYNSLDERTKRNIDSALGIGSLALDVTSAGIASNGVKTGLKTTTKETGRLLTEAVQKSKELSKPVLATIDDFGKKAFAPEVSDAAKVSLNPRKALQGTSQSVKVNVGGKLKSLDELTEKEYVKMQMSTSKSVNAFTDQAKLFAKDRSVKGGSPVEIVGDRVDKVMSFIDRKRQAVGKNMGEIESKYTNQQLEIGESVYGKFTDAVKNFDNPKYGVDTADSNIVRKLVSDFDNLQKGGSTIGERLEFIRSWDKYLNDSKDSFGKFKENATINTRIQNAVRSLKDETVDSIANIDKEYKQLRNQYRQYKQLDEIGDSLLGKEGALGGRVKGAATVKRAIQSNSDAGARQFLVKLRELTGYDAIKDGDLALTAMESAGDYQGLSLLNVVRTGKTGFINKGIEWGIRKVAGDNATRVKRYVKP